MSWLSYAKDIVVALCALLGVSIAVKGLRTWQRQLHGTANFDLARRLLRALYEWRDAIETARLPAIWAAETVPDPGAEPVEREREFHAGVRRAYERRWASVLKARREIETLALETEVLWGGEIRGNLRALNALQFDLVDAISEHLKRQGATERMPPAEIEQSLVRSRILYSQRTNDEFAGQVASALGPLEERLRVHLKRS